MPKVVITIRDGTDPGQFQVDTRFKPQPRPGQKPTTAQVVGMTVARMIRDRFKPEPNKP